MSEERLHGLDLFSGIGGISLALQPWVRTVCYVEIEPYCQRVLRERIGDGHLDDAPIWDDVRTFDPGPWAGFVDIIAGGFPCQDISTAGRGAGLAGERSGLFREIVRLARELRPRFIFLENVAAITAAGRGGWDVIGALAALGYDLRWGVLSAFDVGAPHLRERWWCLAHADAEQHYQPEGQDRAPDEWPTTRGPKHRIGGRREALAHAIGGGCAGPGLSAFAREGLSGIARSGALCEPRGPGRPEWAGAPAEWSYAAVGRADWWEAEPVVGRVADGVPARVDRIDGIPAESAPKYEKGKTAAGRQHRLRGLGNAVVPACAREAFQRLSGWEVPA